MSKPSRFPPYEGRISWSAKDQQWSVRVRHADGGGVKAMDFFQAPVLMEHLRVQGVTGALAANEAQGYVCLVFKRTDSSADLSKIGRTLLRVLQTHYKQFKGRPVNWKPGS